MVWRTLLLLLCCVTTTMAVNSTHIVIGQTVVMYGALSGTGNRTSAGIRLAFQEANDAGGVLSRNMTLVTLDDNGDGSRAIQNIATLNSTYDAFLITATLGNDVFTSILPTLVQSRIPLVGPLTGLSNTRSPFNDVVINLRPSYGDEIVAQARFLVEYLRVQRIACFYTDDALGQDGYAILVDALNSVGMSLVATVAYSTNMTLALETILSSKQKPQAVVLICLDTQVSQFLPRYRLDPRADPNVAFTYLTMASTASIGIQNIGNAYFTRTVPPSAGDFDIARRFQTVAAKYKMSSNYIGGQFSFEGYVLGRFIVEVLRGMRSSLLTREAFLNEVYNNHLFYLDDMPVGLFGRNFSGCQYSICNCNSGMRRIFIASVDPVYYTLLTNPSWPVTEYSITQCTAPSSLIRRPILFGQLLPTDDPLAYRIAQDIYTGIKAAFAEINAAGGLNGRMYDVVNATYSGDPSNATAALLDRWPLVALLGSVVTNGVSLSAAIPRIGTLDLTPHPTEPEFAVADMETSSTTPLELMSLVSYVVQQLGAAVHCRVRRSLTSAALLGTLTKTINTFQSVPESSAEFDSATDALAGLSSGYVIGIGSTSDLLTWVNLLQDRPALTLLTTRPCAMLLLASGSVNLTSSVMRRLLFPSQVESDTTSNFSKLNPRYKSGYLLGTLVAKVLSQSSVTLSSMATSPQDMIDAWYDVQLIKVEALVLGPYYSDNCSFSGDTRCRCNLGTRSLAIVSPNPTSAVVYQYESTTCNVEYQPLNLSASSNDVTLPIVLGSVLGTVFILAIAAALVLYRRRNNRAAPKDASQPFCIIFTDIQASTTLWAKIPNEMALALDTHHHLIRKLIHRYNCYEVKTIGDSFMCATKSPEEALRFALAVQETFHHHQWGTKAINQAYNTLVEEDVKTAECWNGLRVRVGIHFGSGNIKLDPVSHGYDYYGTVVNIAARIESVCHGGQIAISEAMHTALGGHQVGSVWTDLGSQVLRGLSEPLHLYQVLPEGMLSARHFPPLRVDRFDNREEVLGEEADEMGSSHRSTSTLKHAKHSVVPSNDSSSAMGATGKWAEVHPLVQKGETTAEELRHHYTILQIGLCTLLASQVKEVKQQMVRQLCSRMHVTDHGSEGPQLQKTLHGLITRVLPATIVQQLQRRHSKISSVEHDFPLRHTNDECVVDLSCV